MELDKNLIGGSTRLLLLSLLSESARYGYDIIRTLAERSQNVFAFKEGTLYPVLHKLEAEGCIRSYEKVVDGRRRRYYSITEQGKKQLAEERQQWTTFSTAVAHILNGPAFA